MNWILTLITIISILLVVLILLQKANPEEAGLGSGDALGGVNNQKRGFEKTLFETTIVVAVIFTVLNILVLFLQ